MDLTIRQAGEIRDYLTGLCTINDKLTYAAKKNTERIAKAAEEIEIHHNEIMSDLRDDYCLTDKETGAKILQANNAPTYTPEKSKAINQAAKPIIADYLAKSFSFEPYFAKSPDTPGFERINKLDMFTIDKLTGILFDPIQYSEGEFISVTEKTTAVEDTVQSTAE